MNVQSQVQVQFNKYNDIAKLMNKRDLSVNPQTLQKYREAIIPAYNKFVQFLNLNYESVTGKDQDYFDEQLARARILFVKCLDNLKCTHELPYNLRGLIENEQIGQINSRNQPGSTVVTEISHNKNSNSNNQNSRNTSEGQNSGNPEDQNNDNNSENRNNDNNSENQNNDNNSENQNNDNNSENRNTDNNSEDRNSDNNDDRNSENNSEDRNSANNSDDEDNFSIMNALELFNAVNRQFRQNYSGDPLGLTSFIDAVDILSEFATTNDLQKSLVRYVKAKLEGRAREFVTEDIETIAGLKQVLKANIVPENSKVIEGRIASLRYAYSRQEEFSSKAEELADALRRTLIVEGMTPSKANEISIDKTVQLCRKSTNSDIVKSILSSAHFDSPKEVIAKMITENDTCVKEKQILKFTKTQNGKNGNQKWRGRGRNNNQNGNSQNNQGQNDNNRHNGNQRGKSQKWRGNGRQYNNSNSNGYNNRNSNQNNYGYNNNGQNVRVAYSGNEIGPQQVELGAQMGQNF